MHSSHHLRAIHPAELLASAPIFLDVAAQTNAQGDAPGAEVIESGHLSTEHERIVVGQDNEAARDPKTLGDHRQCAHQGERRVEVGRLAGKSGGHVLRRLDELAQPDPVVTKRLHRPRPLEHRLRGDGA